ncbi:hypothetical protein RRG08_061538 [Elysia crispata]|uniref:Uncharacterized protein n=1 Tax=Elysia crispata TaxID=231223 RepID=A0AAE1APA8_9GAST|nr:hypothetical protein RRG08_061538 [Elysia crispata]
MEYDTKQEVIDPSSWSTAQTRDNRHKDIEYGRSKRTENRTPLVWIDSKYLAPPANGAVNCAPHQDNCSSQVTP